PAANQPDTQVVPPPGAATTQPDAVPPGVPSQQPTAPELGQLPPPQPTPGAQPWPAGYQQPSPSAPGAPDPRQLPPPTASPPPAGPTPQPSAPSTAQQPAPQQFAAPAPAAQQPSAHQPAPQQFAAPASGGTAYVNPPGGPTQPPAQAAPQGTGGGSGSRGVLIGVLVAGVAAVLGALAIIGFAAGGDETASDDPQTLTETGPDGSTDRDESSTDRTTTTARETTTTTIATTTTTEDPTPTNPPRPDFLADLPDLPALEAPFTGYRTVEDSNGAFTFRAPIEWMDELPADGQVLVSPDNDAALANQAISGVAITGFQGIGIFDAEFFLNELVTGLADPTTTCTEVKRDDFTDGPFDGIIYGETCEDAILNIYILVSTPDRDAVIFILYQMTDERDIAGLEEVLDSFILFDPALLPAADS
ncbi:MAG: hypothetical protein AAF547_18770, partial [Actinomycetota bacterium]